MSNQELESLASRLEAEAMKHSVLSQIYSDLIAAAEIVRDGAKVMAFIEATKSGELRYEPKERVA